MPEHLVCLTFDYDNVSPAIARDQTTPTMISRGDFGVVGAERLLALLEKHGLRSTWFIPGHSLASYPDPCRKVFAAGHEIGHHGWTHRTPASLGREEEERELIRGNAAIEALTGRRARGYRSPAWDLSAHSIELLLAHGFVYDSSLMGHDYLPYQARDGECRKSARADELRRADRARGGADQLVARRLSGLRILADAFGGAARPDER